MQIVRGDVLDLAAVTEAVKDQDAIICTGSRPERDYSIGRHKEYYRGDAKRQEFAG